MFNGNAPARSKRGVSAREGTTFRYGMRPNCQNAVSMELRPQRQAVTGTLPGSPPTRVCAAPGGPGASSKSPLAASRWDFISGTLVPPASRGREGPFVLSTSP
jgi:hypothetical protein